MHVFFLNGHDFLVPGVKVTYTVLQISNSRNYLWEYYPLEKGCTLNNEVSCAL